MTGLLMIKIKKEQEGSETKERKFNITIQKWHIVMLIALGVALVITSSILSVSKERKEAKKETTIEISENNKASVDKKDPDKLAKKQEEQELKLNNEPGDNVDYSIPVGDEAVNINLLNAGVDNTYTSEKVITIYPENTNVTYQDSYIKLDEPEGVDDMLAMWQNAYNVEVKKESFVYKDYTSYYIWWDWCDKRFVNVYEYIPGSSSFLSIMIEDQTGQRDPVELVQEYAIAF